ncbi:MAG: aldehyde dehydrogenase family protein [Candidatus Melainabacteria bacterium]|nr:aldehyde dehydrogenase family protein [Candidatus Melainabacteria bacterium]MBI3307744.1 aldehyde dehydrogenase family protein [Candidatus Melainabacteria bacterium]
MQTATTTYKNNIGGKLTESSSKDYFEKYNPADKSELLGKFPKSNAKDLEEAIKKAKIAFEKWKKVPAPKRAEVLLKAAEITTKEKEELSQILTKETGKPIVEARGEIQEVIDTYHFFAGEGRRIFGTTGQSELPNKSVITIRQPIGICGLITAWNFPSAVPSWKIAPALLSGNVVILKSSKDAPLSGYKLIENLYKAGLPEGCASVLFGTGEFGDLIVRHPETKVISITGSVEVGKMVYETCGRMLKKCALELGGKNAIVALEDANQELLLDGVLWGAFGTTGQRCTSTSRLIIQKSSWSNSFIEKLATTAKKLIVGNGLNANTQVGPLITEKHRNNVHGFVERAVKEGGNVLTGGKFLTGKDLDKGWFYEPTIISGIKKDMELATTEVFGPVLAVIEVSNFEEAIQVANNVEYGLSCAIYTKDVNKAMSAAHDFESGIAYINAPTIGAECGGATAFGGWKNTGNGSREGGITALDTYTQYKTIYIDYSDRLQRAQID